MKDAHSTGYGFQFVIACLSSKMVSENVVRGKMHCKSTVASMIQGCPRLSLSLGSANHLGGPNQSDAIMLHNPSKTWCHVSQNSILMLAISGV